MTALTLYSLCGVGLFVVGLFAFLAVTNMLRKVLALNIVGAGVFMILIAVAHPQRNSALTQPDPIPHALVLTGIVVAVSATALALALICQYCARTGLTELPEDSPGEERFVR